MFSATLVLSVTLMGTTFAGYAGSSTNNVGTGGDSYGYGYSGSYSGNSGSGTGNIPIPNAPPIPDFSGLFNGYFDSLKKYHEHFITNQGAHSYAISSSSANAKAQAQSSITFIKPRKRLQQQLQQQIQQHAELASRGGFAAAGPSHGGGGSGGSGGFGGSFSGADGGASASAGIGPGGGYHSAQVFPENPSNPNIFSRFGADEAQQGGGGGGSYGVFTSSLSSNVNGKPYHQASTTVNDNGKITTHTVKNP